MLTGSHRSVRVGACTDCRRYWGKYRAEEIDDQEISDVNNQLVASVGTCSVMGTASTMACIAEALGMTVPGGASPPAVTADRMRIAEMTGAQRSEEHTSELQSLMRISYAVFCLKKKNTIKQQHYSKPRLRTNRTKSSKPEHIY